MPSLRSASSCLFGLACGDALGAPCEFPTVHEILARFPPDGPQQPAGDPARVSDDTQMALAVGGALMQTPRPYTPANLERRLRQTFVAWLRDPENNRAPGRTCLLACSRLE